MLDASDVLGPEISVLALPRHSPAIFPQVLFGPHAVPQHGQVLVVFGRLRPKVRCCHRLELPAHNRMEEKRREEKRREEKRRKTREEGDRMARRGTVLRP
jgi:hypothetical protein